MPTVTHAGIIIHCSDTRPDWLSGQPLSVQVEEIRRWHTSPPRNWRDIGYHFIVSRTGEYTTGRPLGALGAHARGHNSDIGICLIGGHGSSADDRPSDHYTPAQLEALASLVASLQLRFGIPDASVIGHNRVAPKACPGFRVQPWLASLRAAASVATRPERTTPAQSKTVRATALDLATKAGAGVASLSALQGPAQYIIIGTLCLSALVTLYILRDRLKAWSEGWR